MTSNFSIPRVVYDCMIFLQGLTKETGPAGTCLDLFDDHAVELLVSHELLAELRDVLTRPKLQLRFSELTEGRAKRLITDLTDRASLIDPVRREFVLERDPKDEKYINLALTASAKYLVSRDRDLVSLMEDNPTGRDFRRRFPQLTILSPVAFLREVEQAQGRA